MATENLEQEMLPPRNFSAPPKKRPKRGKARERHLTPFDCSHWTHEPTPFLNGDGVDLRRCNVPNGCGRRYSLDQIDEATRRDWARRSPEERQACEGYWDSPAGQLVQLDVARRLRELKAAGDV